MPIWVNCVLFALLVVTVPYTLTFRIMQRLPKPIALSYRRWPFVLNLAVTAAVTAYTAVFIRAAYYGRGANSPALLMEFVIAAVAYVFGLVLILRQFAGLYPDYIVSTRMSGLSLRKTAYTNITDVQEISRAHGEARLRVVTSHGMIIPFTLPAPHVAAFYERLKPEL